MKFQWVNFLDQYRIEYVESGPNVAQGNVNIRCPFCGEGDSSHHLGISLAGKGWGCWRSKDHRGVKPNRLVRALLNCSFEEAGRIVGDETSTVLGADDTLGDYVLKMMSSPEAIAAAKLEFPDDIKPLQNQGRGKLFFEYLRTRGYKRSEIEDLAKTYDLRYAISGAFRYRLVIPVVMRQGLVNWTGRSITDDAVVRYRTLSANPEKAAQAELPAATMPIDKTLWNYGELSRTRGKVLVVMEGPLDALRVDYYGREEGIRGTCVFGTGNLSQEQVLLLDDLGSRFDRKVLLLDPDATLQVLGKYSQLEYLGFETSNVPKGYDDPAELDRKAVHNLFL